MDLVGWLVIALDISKVFQFLDGKKQFFPFFLWQHLYEEGEGLHRAL